MRLLEKGKDNISAVKFEKNFNDKINSRGRYPAKQSAERNSCFYPSLNITFGDIFSLSSDYVVAGYSNTIVLNILV